MNIKLSEWADKNNVSYLKAHRMYSRGSVPGAYKDGSHIMVKMEDLPVQPSGTTSLPDLNYQHISIASDTLTRRNKSADSEIPNRFANIDSGLVPVNQTNGSNINVKDAIDLCQKAYFNFDIVRNIIDIMTEFSVGNIFFKGGNKKSRQFCEALLKSINMMGFQDKYYREYYRGGNVFIYEFKKRIGDSDIRKITQVYGLESLGAEKIELPAKFIILNPTDIELQGSVDFSSPVYYKMLNSYEVARLKNPKTDQDKEVFNALSKDVKEAIKSQRTSNVSIPLTPDDVVAIFYKKQDYEGMAVPMIFPVLDNLNWKAELRKMDMAVSRLVNQAILLITMGAEPDKGGINNKNITAMQSLLTNESVGRVLVSDYTTKAQFIIPQIGDILDPKKYESVNQDIFNGLNYILVGDDKFANQSIKVQLFVERLKSGREVFINEFLSPLIKKISTAMGFKSYPEPYYQDINLKNEVEWARIYTRLGELGFLTPHETFDAFETGKMPLKDESLEHQEEFKQLKDKGFYEPIAGGPFTNKQLAEQKQAELSKNNGRPPGTTRQQTTKKVAPIGTNAKFALTKIKDGMLLAQKTQAEINKQLLQKFNLQQLTEEQGKLAEQLLDIVMANEPPDKWEESIASYIENPLDKNKDRVDKINDLAFEYQVDNYLAGILLASTEI
jgi:hypothetical protein